jgi:N6-L-threonylcarbamoyladenine synthase
VVCGGVAANRRLREELARRAEEARVTVYFAPLEFCSDNGAMIAYAAASRLALGAAPPAGYGFGIKPRWDLPASP